MSKPQNMADIINKKKANLLLNDRRDARFSMISRLFLQSMVILFDSSSCNDNVFSSKNHFTFLNVFFASFFSFWLTRFYKS